jgi:HlyD family secretion protein
LHLSAVLEYISPKAVEENGANQFEVKAAITLPSDVTIRSGYSANAEIVLDKVDAAITIPESSLEFSGDSVFVHILTDSIKQTYSRQQVETGISDGVNIEIKKGVKANDKVRGIEIKE